MKAIRNGKDLNNALILILQDVIKEVADKINDKLRVRIDEDVYINRNNYYVGGSKKPTYEFRESVTTSNIEIDKNIVSTEIFHDSEKMSFRPDDFVHGSRYWKHGDDIREYLPKIINDGLSGSLFGSGWWQEERPYFTNTLKELENSGLIRKWFLEAMRKRGLKSI